MELTEYIQNCAKKKNLTYTKLAELTGQGQSNLANKMKRGYFMTTDLEKIADALGATLDIRFLDKKTGLPILEPSGPHEAADSNKLSVTGDVKSTHEFFNRLLQNITFPNGDYTAAASLTVPSDIKIELLSVSESKKESV